MSIFAPNQVEELIIGNAVASETTVATFIASASDKEIKVLSADGSAPASGEDFKILQKTAGNAAKGLNYEFSDVVKADKVDSVTVKTYLAEVQKEVIVAGFDGNVVASTTYAAEVRLYNDGGTLSVENFATVTGYYVTGASVAAETAATVRNGVLASLNVNLSRRGAFEVDAVSKDATKEVQTITIDAALITANVMAGTVDGAAVTQTFATSNDATLAALAVKIANEAGVGTAVVTSVGGDATDDRVIVVTAAVAGTAFVLADFDVTLGASQAGVVVAETTANVIETSIYITGQAQDVVPGKITGRQIEFGVTAKQFLNTSLQHENLELLTTTISSENSPGRGTGKYAVNLEWFTKGYKYEVYRQTGYPADFTSPSYASVDGIYNVIHIKYFDDRQSPTVEKQKKVLTILIDKVTDTLALNANTNLVLDDLQAILGAANTPADLAVA